MTDWLLIVVGPVTLSGTSWACSGPVSVVSGGFPGGSIQAVTLTGLSAASSISLQAVSAAIDKVEISGSNTSIAGNVTIRSRNSNSNINNVSMSGMASIGGVLSIQGGTGTISSVVVSGLQNSTLSGISVSAGGASVGPVTIIGAIGGTFGCTGLVSITTDGSQSSSVKNVSIAGLTQAGSVVIQSGGAPISSVSVTGSLLNITGAVTIQSAASAGSIGTTTMTDVAYIGGAVTVQGGSASIGNLSITGLQSSIGSLTVSASRSSVGTVSIMNKAEKSFSVLGSVLLSTSAHSSASLGAVTLSNITAVTQDIRIDANGGSIGKVTVTGLLLAIGGRLLVESGGSVSDTTVSDVIISGTANHVHAAMMYLALHQ